MVVPPYVAADPAWNFKAFPPIVADMMQKLNAPPVAPGLDPTQVRPNGLLKTSMTPVTGGFWRPRLVNDPGRFIGSGTPPAGANLGPYANLDGGPGKIHFELVGPDGKVDPINGPTVTVKLPDSDIHAWGPAWAHDFMAGTRAARTAAANRNYAALAAHHEMLRVPANPELLDDMTAEAEYRMIDPAYMHVGPEFTRAEVRQRARYHTEFEDEMAAWMEAHGPEAERLAVLEDQEVMNNLFDIAEAQDIREREDRQVANLEAMVAAGHQARGESPPTPRTAAADRARFREFVQGNAANPLDDFDRRLRRAATQLVDAVADDTSERFASSQFIRQMRMIAEGRVVLRDNNLVDLTESDRDNDSDINQATPASSSQADAQRPEHPVR